MNEPESFQGYLDKKTGIEDQNFVIDSNQKADWALRKIADYQKKYDRDMKEIESERKLIDEYEDRISEELDHQKEYFSGLLSAYALRMRQEDPKFKSKALPHGRFGFHKQQPEWKVDKEESGKWFKNNGWLSLYKEKVETNTAEVKKYVKAGNFFVKDKKLIALDSGEIVPGVQIESRPEKFEVHAK